jgi:hypothetical protein
MMGDSKERILTFLGEISEPVDVEKIRTSCGIGNWNTALKHCLELLIQGKIKGQKTSKGWIFWTRQETQLQPWEEVIGKYEDLKISENDLTLILTTQKTIRLSFPRNSPEAQILQQILPNITKGTKLALLKTDNPEKPLLIRTFNETAVADKTTLALVVFRKNILRAALIFVALRLSLARFCLRFVGGGFRFWMVGLFGGIF